MPNGPHSSLSNKVRKFLWRFGAFGRWIDSVRKEVKALVTGSLLLSMMGMVNVVFHVHIPGWCYAVVIIFFLGLAFFRAWLKTDTELRRLNKRPRIMWDIQSAYIDRVASESVLNM